jgi:hypothetical protein
MSFQSWGTSQNFHLRNLDRFIQHQVNTANDATITNDAPTSVRDINTLVIGDHYLHVRLLWFTAGQLIDTARLAYSRQITLGIRINTYLQD